MKKMSKSRTSIVFWSLVVFFIASIASVLIAGHLNDLHTHDSLAMSFYVLGYLGIFISFVSIAPLAVGWMMKEYE